MKAIVTGASSGIGADIARSLAKRGCDIIIVARRKEALDSLAAELGNDVCVRVVVLDLSVRENCVKLYEMTKNDGVDILVNNAGFGAFGEFTSTSLERELALIDTNVTAVHILTKLFLQDFAARNSGYILNVASSAAFTVGPLMAAYYASKSYVFRLTQAICEEVRHAGKNVDVSVLCPGPVDTEFNTVAGVKFGVKALKSADVAEYAVKCMLKHKKVIIPGATIKLARVAGKIVPDSLLARFGYNIQKKKED